MGADAERSQVEDLILDQLNKIHQSLENLRDEVHGSITKIATLEQWKVGHEKQAEDRWSTVLEHTAAIATHKTLIDGMAGGLQVIRWVGSVLALAAAAAEVYFHAGGGK